LKDEELKNKKLELENNLLTAVIGKLKKEKEIITKEKEYLETLQESMEINIT
jgi:hypothetical protein